MTISSKNFTNNATTLANSQKNTIVDHSDEALLPENIKLEANEVDLGALRQIDGFKEIKYKDAVYLGTVINGKRHGKGVMKYRNGR